MIIQIVKNPTEEILNGVNQLIPQLKISASKLTRKYTERLLASDAITLFIARSDEGEMIGMLTLIVYPVPTGIRARIEDVVVEERMRGQGVGADLLKHALEQARAKGADGVALTSNPRRVEANKLYQKLGFKKWETNVYFYKF